MSEYHNPVLLKESVDYLISGNPQGVYADATFGGGGHSREILRRLTEAGEQAAEANKQEGKTSEQSAEASKQAGKTSEQAAEANKQEGKTSEQSAEASKQAGKTSEQAAEASKQAAEASKQEGKTSEQSAEASEQAGKAGQTGTGRLIAFDKDADAIAGAFEDQRLTLIRNNFRFIHNFILNEGYTEGIDGILADLGVSSHQFDTPERGFSFRFDALLDMRMNKNADKTASDIVNSYSFEDLERILRLYGEVEGSRKAASLIVKARSERSILTTGALKEALQSMLPPTMEHKVLAKIFQALRIEVNGEMKDLEKFLYGASQSLKPGGRLVVITYHSLEDRMVKNFMKSGNIDGQVKKDLYGNAELPFRTITKKPIEPTDQEISNNTRARSAKLRVATKI